MEGWTTFVWTWEMYSEEGSMVVLRSVTAKLFRSLGSVVCLKGYMQWLLLMYWNVWSTSFSRLSWKRGAKDGKGPFQTYPKMWFQDRKGIKKWSIPMAKLGQWLHEWFPESCRCFILCLNFFWLSVRDSLRLLGFPCQSLICGCSNKIQTPIQIAE